MLWSDVENPPVDMVLNAWHTLSKKLIGPHHRSMTSVRVSTMYMPHRRFAVALIRGRSLSWVMPVTSALNICMPPEWLSMGITARVNRIIPMPPIHCIRHRHICMPCEKLSIDRSTEAPVVVNPDIDSKKASLSVSGVPHSINGSMPKQENTIHTSDVIRNPSRLPILLWLGRI